jgi:Protein of unknown function (DUF4054)
MDICLFRENFPEFSDESLYTNELITFWSTIAENLVDIERWGNLREQGVNLATAHYISLAIKEQRLADSGAVPGSSAGAITSKKVGDVSVNYDYSANADSSGGSWNSTSYGRLYLSLVKMFGVGCVQL